MLNPDPPLEMTTDDGPPCEHVPVAPDPGGTPCPAAFRDRILVHVVHDGANVPARFLSSDTDPEEVAAGFFEERDWGASHVAAALASAMHLPGYHRINVARVLLDFNRFPGITPRFADHMSRFAINQPFASTLGHADKRALLEDLYDPISAAMEEQLVGKLIKICIHTYDERNVTDTRRPAVSILSRAHGLSHKNEIPIGLFDPLFPSELAEFTCDRILRSRISLTLEEAAVHVADNYPYSLPEGSIEVRSQVWFFFRHVRERYDLAHPPTAMEADDPTSPRNLVWQMLLDTNLRNADSDLLRSYLHMFRRPPERWRSTFEAARTEYERIAAFLRERYDELVLGYRNSVDRPSSLVIEVRKDLVFDFDGRRALGPRVSDARMLARLVARALDAYLTTDRTAKAAALADRDQRFH